MYKLINYIKLLLCAMLCTIFIAGCNEEYPYNEIKEDEMPLRQLVGKYYGAQNFYVGMVPGESKFFDAINNYYRLLFTNQFSVISIDTALNQEFLLKEPRAQFNDILYRPYFSTARQYNLSIYAKSSVSKKTSAWLSDTNNKLNTTENVRFMLTNIIKRLSNDFQANKDVVGWMEVVDSPFNTKSSSNVFALNPWFQLGDSEIGFQEGSTTVIIPEYIILSLQLANQHAPDVKKIISQDGELNMMLVERMKNLLLTLRNAGMRIDGIAWNANFQYDISGVGFAWTKPDAIAANEKILGEFIDWCYRNRFEFHLSSIELELQNLDQDFGLTNEFAVEVTRDEQKAVLQSFMSVILPRVGRGVSTIQFNGFNDIIPETGIDGIKPRLFDVNNNPTPLYQELRNLLSKQINN